MLDLTIQIDSWNCCLRKPAAHAMTTIHQLAGLSAGVVVRTRAAVVVANSTNKRKSRCRCMPTSLMLPPTLLARTDVVEMRPEPIIALILQVLLEGMPVRCQTISPRAAAKQGGWPLLAPTRACWHVRLSGLLRGANREPREITLARNGDDRADYR